MRSEFPWGAAGKLLRSHDRAEAPGFAVTGKPARRMRRALFFTLPKTEPPSSPRRLAGRRSRIKREQARRRSWGGASRSDSERGESERDWREGERSRAGEIGRGVPRSWGEIEKGLRERSGRGRWPCWGVRLTGAAGGGRRRRRGPLRRESWRLPLLRRWRRSRDDDRRGEIVEVVPPEQ